MPSLFDKMLQTSVKESQPPASTKVISTAPSNTYIDGKDRKPASPQEILPVNHKYQEIGEQKNLSLPQEKTAPADLLANQQTSKSVSQQTDKPASQQNSKSASQFTDKEANQFASKLARPETTKEKKKYGTYLREESISAIQMLAIQTKQKDHEVLQEIVDSYFEAKK